LPGRSSKSFLEADRAFASSRWKSWIASGLTA
jgi:hypothetical protein